MSSIEELPFYASEFGIEETTSAKVNFTILNDLRVDTYCFPCSAAITKDTALVKFHRDLPTNDHQTTLPRSPLLKDLLAKNSEPLGEQKQPGDVPSSRSTF